MASVTFTHARDHAVVVFDGELDWAAARELVETLDTVAGGYFYREVELVVSSPGGNIGALQYVLDRFEQLEAQGVRVCTRVLSSAGSAAAIIVALGHERVAEPDAILSFHCAQLTNANEINAQSTAAIHSVLNELDGRMVGRLVGRVLATADAKRPPHRAERADRRVLELVAGSLGRSGRKLPRKVRQLARAVGAFVDRAVRDEDREALSRLYRRLFEIEATVSARLAVTLRLLDRIGCEPAGATLRGDDEGLTVPEWRVLYPPHGTVPRQALCRHALVLGETGSGKTASCILPAVAAMARTPRNRLGGALIIDPKRELGRTLRDLAPERVHEIQADRVVLKIMSGPRWALEEDLASGRWLSAARRVLCRAASLVRSSPARVLMDHEVGSSNAEFFDREGTALAQAVLACVLMVTHPGTAPPEQWLEDDVGAFIWADDLVARARGRPGERGPNALALAGWCLDGPLMSWSPPRRSTVLVSGDGAQSPPVEWLFARVARAALASVCREPGEGWDLCERVLGYWSAMVEVERQYAGVRAVASVICSDFATPSIASTLYLGCEPGYRAAREDGNGLDFARLVAADGPGTLVLFEPARDGLDALIAISLKALFFESVLDDPDRAGGGANLPLVAYVADEFHRFVTSDVVHGEQSFLDTCRSYSAFCVLACQSVASVEHALAHGAGSPEQNRSAVSVLLSNTATKFYFRTTDPHTAERVGELCPSRPGLAGVVRVRPVSTLAAGEAYIALSDGRFERRQLQPFVGATPGPEKAPARPVALLEGPDRAGGRG